MSGTRPAAGPTASSASRRATSVASIGWNDVRGGTVITGKRARAWQPRRMRSWNWVARSTGPRQPGTLDLALHGELGLVVGERHAVDADDRDVGQMRAAGPAGRLDQVAGRAHVTAAGGAVDDHVGSRDRRVDTAPPPRAGGGVGPGWGGGGRQAAGGGLSFPPMARFRFLAAWTWRRRRRPCSRA